MTTLAAMAAAPGSSTSPDGELVVLTIAGDSAAYAELVRRHQQVLHRHLRGMGVDRDTAMDLVQDAFVRAYVRLGECRDPAHFRAWLFSIGRNLCLDYLKNVRRQTVSLSELPYVERTPAGRIVPNEATGAVREALDRLTPLLREAFLLKHDAGYTYDEIAAIAGVSPSAVKMRVHRAREILCAALHEYSAVTGDVTIHRSSVVLHHERNEYRATAETHDVDGVAHANPGAEGPEQRSES